MATKPFNNSILDRQGHPDGMRVPEGYFESFARDMMSRLPENELEKQPVKELTPPTLWQRIRPFAYMAAMFAGIWCMMKMFAMIHQSTDTLNDPTQVSAGAFAQEDFVFDYVIDDYSNSQLLDELYADGFSADDFNI